MPPVPRKTRDMLFAQVRAGERPWNAIKQSTQRRHILRRRPRVFCIDDSNKSKRPDMSIANSTRKKTRIPLTQTTHDEFTTYLCMGRTRQRAVGHSPRLDLLARQPISGPRTRVADNFRTDICWCEFTNQRKHLRGFVASPYIQSVQDYGAHLGG